MIIGKSFHFCAAHFIPNHPKCGEVHGHDYTVTIEVQGERNPDTGMVMDLLTLSNEMHIICGKLDHTLLNKIMAIPTIENLILYFEKNLRDLFEEEAQLYSITIQEGSKGYARKYYDVDASRPQ